MFVPGSVARKMSGGQRIYGGRLSVTVIVKVRTVVLPDVSIALTVTVVVPIGKELLEAGSEM